MSATKSPTITVMGPDGKQHIIHSDEVGLAALLDCLQGAEIQRQTNERLIAVCEETIKKLTFLEAEGIVQMPLTIQALKQAIAGSPDAAGDGEKT